MQSRVSTCLLFCIMMVSFAKQVMLVSLMLACLLLPFTGKARPEVVCDGTLFCRQPGDLQWRIGTIHRFGMKLSASGGSITQARDDLPFAMRRDVDIAHAAEPQPTGLNQDDINRYIDRDFDDGFVHLDELAGIHDDWTVRWGYDKESQYDPQAETLTFRRDTTRSYDNTAHGSRFERHVQTDTDDALAQRTSFGSLGLTFEMDYILLQRGKSGIALSAGFSMFPGMKQSLSDTTFRQTILDRRYTSRDHVMVTDEISDTYVFRTVDPVPDAPYDGSDADYTWDARLEILPAEETGRHIERTSRREYNERLQHMAVWRADNRVDLEVSADLLQVSIGPRFQRRAGASGMFHADIEITLNRLWIYVERYETFTATHADGRSEVLFNRHDRRDASDWMAGARASLGFDLRLGETWLTALRAGYEWIDRAQTDIGPNRISVDLSGYTAALFIGAFFQ